MDGSSSAPACSCAVPTSLLASSCAGRRSATALCRSGASRARSSVSATARIPCCCEHGWLGTWRGWRAVCVYCNHLHSIQFVHTHTHTHKRARAHTHTHTHTHAHMNKCICISMCVYMYMYIYKYMYIYIRVYTYTKICINICMYTHIYVHINI